MQLNQCEKTCEDGLTGHAEGSPQPPRVFLPLFELHAADSDNLTDQKQSLPHQIAAAQVLDTNTKVIRETCFYGCSSR